MIGKTIIGRSFKGCLNYNLDKVDKGLGEILESRGVRDFDRQAMIRDFNFRRGANKNLSKCVWHTALSFQDKLSNDQMLTVAKKWLAGMGLDQTQYVIIRHTDTIHPHLHIVANRINDEGLTVSDSQNWKRSETLCRELIVKYKLTSVPGERNEARINRDKLKGRDLLKTDVNRVLKEVLSKSRSLDEFSFEMATKGITCNITFNPDKSIRGVSFERGEVKIKASDIHKSYSAHNLAHIIELNRVSRRAQQQMSVKKENQSPGFSSPTPKLGSMGKDLDTSEDDEKKRKKRNDFEMGM